VKQLEPLTVDFKRLTPIEAFGQVCAVYQNYLMHSEGLVRSRDEDFDKIRHDLNSYEMGW
jgi:hypothetical protein